jgi:HTH-type transcriptional regulator/antitoxin HigA
MTKIENRAQYDWAVARVETLLPLVTENTPPGDANSIELVLLSNLVADYSDANFAIGKPSLADILRLRMYEMGLTQKALAELLDVSPSRVNEYLTGKSEPTLKVARTINTRLSIDANIILGT